MQLISDGKPLYLASEGKKSFRLIEDWKFEHDCFTPVLVVPEGYKSDLASIPSWIFWWQWSERRAMHCPISAVARRMQSQADRIPRGSWNIAAIAHDYIYEKGFVLSDWARFGEKFKTREPIHLSRAEADMLFYEICLYLGRVFGKSILTEKPTVGVRPVTAKLMYWAVRLFGRGQWEK